jgi:histidinol phosphatase-like enzyme
LPEARPGDVPPDLDLDLARSVYVGDKIKDVQPALGFGGRGVLVRTGYGANEESSAPAGVEIADDIAHAAQIILGPFRTGPSSG